VIITGDFGGIWDDTENEKYWLEWLDSRNFTTLFVDGNHENFDLLNAYPVEVFCGGKVHKIMPSVIHLMRGEVFEIADRKFFTIGGGKSHDMSFRTAGLNWWSQEMPNNLEYLNAENNLAKHDYTVDCIISHCAPTSILSKISRYFNNDELTDFLEESVKVKCKYRKWFFGHYHVDAEIDEKHVCLFNSVIRIKR
jgi:hypothetical protein